MSAGGNGLINMNVLWELADSQYLIKNVLERAKGLINGVVSGAGLPIKLAELTSQFKVFYYPIVSSGRALQILIKRGYDKYKEYMGGVIYEALFMKIRGLLAGIAVFPTPMRSASRRALMPKWLSCAKC